MLQIPPHPNRDSGDKEGTGFCKDCDFPAVGEGRLLCTFCKEDREKDMKERLDSNDNI